MSIDLIIQITHAAFPTFYLWYRERLRSNVSFSLPGHFLMKIECGFSSYLNLSSTRLGNCVITYLCFFCMETSKMSSLNVWPVYFLTWEVSNFAYILQMKLRKCNIVVKRKNQSNWVFFLNSKLLYWLLSEGIEMVSYFYNWYKN